MFHFLKLVLGFCILSNTTEILCPNQLYLVNVNEVVYIS